MQTRGLQLDDAPPLAVPLSFFLTALVAIAAAGALLMKHGDAALATRWSPLTLALTHLGTLGFLTMVMLGAIYQMIAVVLGSPVPWIRLAHAVHALFVVGAVALVYGLGTFDPTALRVAAAALGISLLAFILPVSMAISRAESLTPTSFGIGAAIACLFFTAAIGIIMAHGLSVSRLPGPRELWTRIHFGVALVGWLGSLITAVSWQVVPMFYLTRNLVPREVKWAIQIVTLAGTVIPVTLVMIVSLTGNVDVDVALGKISVAILAPAVFAVWILHPLVTWWSLRGRRRLRTDGSLLFWRTSLAIAPCTAIVAVCAYALEEPRWDVLFGWLAIWGWAGMIVHGMMTRIVPFLVWLHRFAPLVGEVPVPSVKKLLRDRWTLVSYGAHLTSFLLGVLAIATGIDAIARLAGLALVATAASLAHSLLRVVLRRPPARPLNPPGALDPS